MGSYKPPEDGYRYSDADPQRRREDVVFEVPMRPTTLDREKELNGWRDQDCVDGKYPNPARTAGTRGAADEEAVEGDQPDAYGS